MPQPTLCFPKETFLVALSSWQVSRVFRNVLGYTNDTVLSFLS